GESDDRGFRVLRESGQAAAKRGAGPARPVGTGDGLHRQRVRPADDDDLVDGALAQRREHLREQLDLLRRLRPVAGRGAGGQHDGENRHVSVTVTKPYPKRAVPSSRSETAEARLTELAMSRYQLPGQVRKCGV